MPIETKSRPLPLDGGENQVEQPNTSSRTLVSTAEITAGSEAAPSWHQCRSTRHPYTSVCDNGPLSRRIYGEWEPPYCRA